MRLSIAQGICDFIERHQNIANAMMCEKQSVLSDHTVDVAMSSIDWGLIEQILLKMYGVLGKEMLNGLQQPLTFKEIQLST